MQGNKKGNKVSLFSSPNNNDKLNDNALDLSDYKPKHRNNKSQL
jgi:hypothetical protein